ncbi:hypothetical protein NDU88_009335 [Pleurodeles waltl]|uniref:Uncharacterized protein n=1 Tax=Pleurodeles waltl TaxID=8319 RepID=A0AAV7RY55_PLEWA|nr:hypothetical protein NDU88_009335 [Pleurodeles waltl]
MPKTLEAEATGAVSHAPGPRRSRETQRLRPAPWAWDPSARDCRPRHQRPSEMRGRFPCPGMPTVASAHGAWKNRAARSERRWTVSGDRTEQTD